MSLASIKTALYTKLESLSGLPTIYYPNISATVPTDTYIRPDVLPGTTTPVGIKTTDKEIGIFQVSIFIKKGTGEIAAANIAQIILDGFPRNLSLTGVRIHRTGSIGSAIFSDNWQMTPVSIIYQNLS